VSPRRRWALASFAGALLVAAVAYAAHTPGGLVAVNRLDYPLVAWAAFWTLVVAGVVLWRPRRLAVALLVLPVLALGYATGAAALLGRHEWSLVTRTVSPDRRREARLVEGYDAIDPVWQVRVRTHRGLLSTERVVWESYEFPEPVSVRFAGAHRLTVVASGGTTYDVAV
jgi:hypothetical protein